MKDKPENIITGIAFALVLIFSLNFMPEHYPQPLNQVAEEQEEETLAEKKRDILADKGLKAFEKNINDVTFSTYYPQKVYITEGGGAEEGNASVFYSINDNKRLTYVWFFFPTSADTVNIKQLENVLKAKKGLIDINQWQIVNQSGDPVHNWVKKKMDFVSNEAGQKLKGTIYLCKSPQYRNSFYIVTQYPEESESLFKPEINAIISNVKFRENLKG